MDEIKTESLQKAIADQYTSSNSRLRRNQNAGSALSTGSAAKRTTPNKILGDFHIKKINQVFHDF